MHPDLRHHFDCQLEAVLQELPPEVHRLLDEVPLIVDDYPSPAMCRRVGVRRPDELCGLYDGIPLTHRSVADSGVPSDVIHIFRAGILRMAGYRRDGTGDERRLREQIRITILHEVGHHFGLTEEDLEELGYG